MKAVKIIGAAAAIGGSALFIFLFCHRDTQTATSVILFMLSALCVLIGAMLIAAGDELGGDDWNDWE